MIVRKRLTLVAAAALACAGLVGTAPASAGSPAEAPAAQPGVTVLATGLNGPRQVSGTSKYLYVAESDAAQVSRVSKASGAVKLQVSGAALAQGVVRTNDRFYIASGEQAPDDARAVNGSSEILVAKTGRRPSTFADLLAYELKHNPDNQTQFGEDGNPLDALSNPYFVVRSQVRGGFLLAADAGGNDVLAISRSGKVSTFFVPPSVTTGPCAGAEQNSDAGPSCDAVPTGLAWGPDGNLYVSAATGLAPGEGRVYVVNKNGRLVRTWTGFDGPTGVAVGADGAVYVSELLEGLPGEPGAAAGSVVPSARAAEAAAAEPAFDPATVGRVVKVAPNGDRTFAQVTMPAGLLYADGTLYASAWAVAGEFGIADAGQVVKVDASAFSK
ncbi:hypothetical protein SAMN04488544_1913 [Microlunatus sagamiharensis]|uniref:ScyD/ScyE family protein n=1 Tax=Microlunatus sagamiharensis TaxID=546874 RepID=A0A1H2MEW2_9ACTN|nr:ScyD/ScyE family protein [Microlunatus sagamiharensis]SDU91575.1 hypothetical protein SAMN04488544_1913 [Microlunatus sagamiharensis]